MITDEQDIELSAPPELGMPCRSHLPVPPGLAPAQQPRRHRLKPFRTTELMLRWGLRSHVPENGRISGRVNDLQVMVFNYLLV